MRRTLLQGTKFCDEIDVAAVGDFLETCRLVQSNVLPHEIAIGGSLTVRDYLGRILASQSIRQCQLRELYQNTEAEEIYVNEYKFDYSAPPIHPACSVEFIEYQGCKARPNG